MRAPGLARAAAAVLMLEALALAVVVVIESMGLLSGEATSQMTAFGLVGLTAIGAVALAAFSVNVARGKSWARSGAVVLHVIAVVIAIASLTIQPPAVEWAAIIGIPGLVGLVLLLMSQREEGGPARPKSKPAQPEADEPAQEG